MTTYTGWGATDPGFTWAADTGVYSLGTAFYVNTTGLYLAGYRLFRVTGHTVSGINFGTFAGAVGGGHGATGSVLTGTTLSSQSTTVDGWNQYLLPSLYGPLTANTVYYAEYFTDGGVNGGYPAFAFAFSADHNASPIIMPADGVQVFGNIPYNGGYVTPVASLSPVNASFHNTLYGLDIIVSTNNTSTSSTAADSLVVSETVVRSGLTLARGVADSVPLSDSLARSTMTRPRPLADSLALSDGLARGSLTMSRTLADSFLVQEAVTTASAHSVRFGRPRQLASRWPTPRRTVSRWPTPRHIPN